MLAEKKQLTSAHGRAAFAILLFQDLAVIPLLALIPLLGPSQAQTQASNMVVQTVVVIAVVAGLVLGGRFLLRHVLRLIASSSYNFV